MLLGSENDLIARIRAIYGDSETERTLSILCGSGLTSTVISSPGRIVESTRRGLPPDDQQDLDSALDGKTDDAERYRTTFEFLALRRAPNYRDRIVQLATLGAYRGITDGQDPDLSDKGLSEYEDDGDNWKLPAGVESLGRIWSGTPNSKRGPILTSNFDPLCEVAIRKAGRSPVTRVIDTDGSFLRDVGVASEPQVVHFHGYWRGSTTLSMASQLVQDRPALGASIRSLLKRNTLLVIGYAGWNDALTNQIVEAIREQESGSLDILWCYFGNAAELELAMEQNPVLRAVSRAPGNVQFYYGIDSNKFLPRLEKSLSEHLVYSEALRGRSPGTSLIGWQAIDRRGLPVSQNSKSEQAAALTFFDGRLPNWEDVSSSLIPMRDVTSSCINQVRKAISERTPSMSLLLGPSGEGKTTALMQVAAALSNDRRADLVILHHPAGGLNSPDEVLALPPGKSYVLVLDEASRCVDRLRELVQLINAQPKSQVHLVLSARTSDWRNSGGSSFSWRQHIRFFEHSVLGMTRNDAISVVDAWGRIGDSALGELRRVSDREGRVQHLLSAARDGAAYGEGAFLGALLRTRYGSGFDSHVIELMKRLGQWEAPGSELHSTLLDVFATIALPHSLGIRQLTPKLLAKSIDSSVDELFHGVLPKLGDEAAVAYSNDVVLVRHTMIARSAIDRANEGGVDLTKVLSRLVAAAVSEVESEGMTPELYSFAYMSKLIDDPKLSVAAARSAVESSPYRLSYRSSYSRALRIANQPRVACEVADETLGRLKLAPDLATGARPFLTEWGIAEGSCGRWARNAAIAGAALVDNFHLGPLRADQAMATLYCLSMALRKLAERDDSDVFVDAAHAIYEITGSDRLEARDNWTDDLELWLRSYNRRSSVSSATALRSILTALDLADTLLETPFVHPLPNAARRFTELNHLASW